MNSETTLRLLTYHALFTDLSCLIYRPILPNIPTFRALFTDLSCLVYPPIVLRLPTYRVFLTELYVPCMITNLFWLFYRPIVSLINRPILHCLPTFCTFFNRLIVLCIYRPILHCFPTCRALLTDLSCLLTDLFCLIN